jgi:hypothetical protein
VDFAWSAVTDSSTVFDDWCANPTDPGALWNIYAGDLQVYSYE